MAGLDASDFLQRRLVQDAVVRNLEVIGEASRNIERDAPDFAVWATIQTDLPRLRDQVQPLPDALAEQAPERSSGSMES